ncbi:hypothetical protein [Nocardioides limicola]|uniref:hypothetical protein n=1 Tax=Nocardioides limicola TaxID=2803368 RepID=UPI00193C446C|nr:hypothetical protein [Nocardioides sp. DJM-14]
MEHSVLLPAGGAVTGWAACRLHGVNLLDGLATDGRTPLPVPLLVGRAGTGHKGHDGVRLLYADPGEVEHRHGIPVVSIERAVCDAMWLTHDLREAVVVMDMAAAARLTSITRVRDAVAARPRATGVILARQALTLANERSASPNETRTRLIWVLDAGLPSPLANCAVHGARGQLLGIADLLDVEAGLAVEYDGADHRDVRRHSRDVRKESAFREHGIEVVRVTGPDLADRGAVAARLIAARARARFEPVARRSWRAALPAVSLDQQLAEAEVLAELRREWSA